MLPLTTWHSPQHKMLDQIKQMLQSVNIFLHEPKNKQHTAHNMAKKLLKTAASFQLFLHVTVVLPWLYK